MLIIWVAALVALLGMAAMAVDLGNIAQTKEHAETAVQDAALAAARDLTGLYPGGPTQGDYAAQEQNAVSDAETYLLDNYSSATDFSGCAPDAFPSSLYILPGQDCVAFFDPSDSSSPSDNEQYASGVAVALPDQSVSYSVGRAAGLDSQQVSAVAYASLFSLGGATAAVPFGYPVTGPAGLQCLKRTSEGTCAGFETGAGQFGTILSPRFSIVPGFSTGAATTYLEEDLALGIDHNLKVDASGATVVCDGEQGSPPSAQCNGNYDYPPGTAAYGSNDANFVNFNSGLTRGVLTPALFTGVTSDSSQGCGGGAVIPP